MNGLLGTFSFFGDAKSCCLMAVFLMFFHPFIPKCEFKW